MYNRQFMAEAIRLAKENVKNGTGGPFGAVIVKDGEVIVSCVNTVTPDNDPTAHAEVNAIREACRKLKTYQLEGCEIYASCEPCPMCLGAIYWARPSKVYYASTKEEAAGAGFDDSFIYKEITLLGDERSIPFLKIEEQGAGEEFNLWNASDSKELY
ncbi:nucleoside deaminase [Bacteroides acidifaciens]|uniref:nucleoside deaminase n=1 Tax=Bacteroides acidifaciens TaxID=85831 RepID=UPI00255810A8|nr:nucleoside deaminase [Bacteroides acidifaciens]